MPGTTEVSKPKFAPCGCNLASERFPGHSCATGGLCPECQSALDRDGYCTEPGCKNEGKCYYVLHPDGTNSGPMSYDEAEAEQDRLNDLADAGDIGPGSHHMATRPWTIEDLVRRNMTALDEAMEGTDLQRFAPDLGVFVTWHRGSSTFHVWSYAGAECSETDVWTHYGDDRGNPPTFEQALASVDEHFAALRSEVGEES